MKPNDLDLVRQLSSPTVSPDGTTVVFAVAQPSTEQNKYLSSLWRLSAGDGEIPRRLTFGTSDRGPRFSPDGGLIAFLRTDEKKRPQLHVLGSDGGDARPLTDQPGGVLAFSWHPDSARIVYTARVPEAGRYGTDEEVSAEQEAPRLITKSAYLSDGLGYLLDRPAKLFTVELADQSADGVPDSLQVTTGAEDDNTPLWSIDGRRIVFTSAREPDGADKLHENLANDLYACDPDGGALERLSDGTLNLGRAATLAGSTDLLVTGHLVGESKQDFVGRPGSAYRISDGAATALTDPVVEVVSDPVVDGEVIYLTAEERGDTVLLAQHGDGTLSRVLDGRVTVGSFDAAGGTIAAVAATPDSFSELFVGDSSGLTRRSDFGAALRDKSSAYAIKELTATSPDGYEVHGWVVRPAGPGPHPVLLNIHGGPFAQYPSTMFDEPQVYAGAGYAVVMCNPRGSSGYGGEHGRSLKDAVGTVDAQDITAFLEAALSADDLDSTRVGVMGGSYGGLMTTWMLGHTDRFVAGISERAVNAWDSFAGTSDIGWFFRDEYVGANTVEQSPFTYADNIQTPLLIIHSEQDYRCPLEQGQRLFASLRARGVETELLIFPGEGHELSRSGQPRHRQQRFEHILRWWAKHLPVGA